MGLRKRTSPGSLTFESFGVPVQLTIDADGQAEPVREVHPPGWSTSRATPSAGRFELRQVGNDSYEVAINDRTELHQAALDIALGLLEAQIRLYVAEKAKDHIFVHAGVVAAHGKALIAPGKSFSGKTTLVKALVEAGATYFSDEYAVFDRSGRVHPYPRRLSLRTPTGHEQRDVRELGGIAGDEAGELGVVALTQYRPGGVWNPARLSGGQGLTALLADTIPARERPQESLTTLRRAITPGVSILQGERGEAEPVAAALLDELAGLAQLKT
jgi:hypothetical protein